MSATAATHDQGCTCGCCAGLDVSTPALVDNRAGLSAIAYRIGTHGAFKASMLSRLSSADFPAIAKLLTRDDDDFAIGVLDAWAMVADVLTFYQERLANESYLRTATERLSVLELARLIGYQLRPGVAAETWLAFNVEDAVGAPGTVTLPVGLQVQSVPGQDEKPQTFETSASIEAQASWNALRVRQTVPHVPAAGSTDAYFAGTGLNLKPGDPLLFLGDERKNSVSDSHWEFRLISSVGIDTVRQLTHVTWAVALGSFAPVQHPEVHVLRKRVAVFGHNAPRWQSMPTEFKNNYITNGDSLGEWPDFSISPVAGAVDLDAVHQQVVPESWLVLSTSSSRQLYHVDSVTEVSRAEFAMSGKVTRAMISGPSLAPFTDQVRQSTVFAASELLELAEAPLPDTDLVSGESIELASTVSGLVPGQRLAIGGVDAASKQPVSYVLTLASVEAAGNVSRLILEPPGLPAPLARTRDRTTNAPLPAINANVAPANHGETVNQILGSGDARQPHQRFLLRHAPLTYISADNATGVASTLQVYVNDVLWHEADTLFDRGPAERLFVTRPEGEDTRVVQTGDGVRGARLPTGQGNVRAVYRKGIGLAGNVAAGALTTLLTRPLGLKDVTNPRAASGGDDPETLDRARQNAPLGVLTLGRVVSLTDYTDFTRAFAGVAKALAVWLPMHGARGVFLTIAGPDGATIGTTDATFVNLLAALEQAGDPFVRVSVASFRPATFRVALKIRRDPDYLRDKVFADVEAALRGAFAFEARGFAQPVHLSEVVAVVQGVAGVVAVDVDKLYRGTVSTLQQRLDADRPYVGSDGTSIAAELLTLSGGPLDSLQEMP
jgi:hypothetical protein